MVATEELRLLHLTSEPKLDQPPVAELKFPKVVRKSQPKVETLHQLKVVKPLLQLKVVKPLLQLKVVKLLLQLKVKLLHQLKAKPLLQLKASSRVNELSV
ncbi:MAG: hypothetical protein O2945_05435 [Planctomycetota bacterium]|nr:hypothetical protein [Planctomycetota bacterium]